MNLAAMVFMISLLPAKIRVTRMSRQARAMGCSSPSSSYLYAPHPMITSSILCRYVVFATTFFVA
jgi:hypothetical protein